MKLNAFTRFFLILPMLVVFVFATSCKNQNKQAVSETDIKKDIEEYVYPLISAFDVTTMLTEIEATYIVDIANEAENVEKYFTEQSKAVNLGVYVADLAYATTYNQKSAVQQYFKAIESLVTDLDLTAAIGKELANEIESNLDNTEVLVDLITKLSQNAYASLNKQGRTELSYLVLAGTALEGLYLTTHISENTLQNPKIVETILYQKEPLMKLQTLMEPYAETELSASIYQMVKSINQVYAMEESTSAMTLEQIEQLSALLNQIRAETVQQ